MLKMHFYRFETDGFNKNLRSHSILWSSIQTSQHQNEIECTIDSRAR